VTTRRFPPTECTEAATKFTERLAGLRPRIANAAGQFSTDSTPGPGVRRDRLSNP